MGIVAIWLAMAVRVPGTREPVRAGAAAVGQLGRRNGTRRQPCTHRNATLHLTMAELIKKAHHARLHVALGHDAALQRLLLRI